MIESEGARQAREAEEERSYERSLLSFCVTEDEYLEVRRGIIPDRVQRRYEAHMRGDQPKAPLTAPAGGTVECRDL